MSSFLVIFAYLYSITTIMKTSILAKLLEFSIFFKNFSKKKYE